MQLESEGLLNENGVFIFFLIVSALNRVIGSVRNYLQIKLFYKNICYD